MTRTPARAGSTTRRHALAAVAAAGTIALAGCGGTQDDAQSASPAATASASAASTTTAASSDAQPVDAVLAAATTSSKEASAAFDLTVKTSAGGQEVPVTGHGVFDDAAGVLRMQLTTQAQGQGATTIEERVVDGTVYLSGMPGVDPGTWVKVDPAQLGAMGSSGGMGVTATDPSQQLQMLDQVSDDVQKAGTETVHGVRATRYTGTIDLQKAVDASGQQGADPAQVRQQLSQLGLTSMPFELYVDDEGRPARMTTTVDATAEGQEIHVVSTIDFSDWGTSVDVQAPAHAVPLEQVAGAQGSAATPAG